MILTMKAADYNQLRVNLFLVGVGLSITLSYICLYNLILPGLIAGTITMLMALGYIGLTALAWYALFKLTKGYAKQFMFATKGEVKNVG